MSLTSSSPPTVVLKFGSSVLRTRADLFRVVAEIYRHVREGEHVLAVVSAFAGETNRLLARANSWGTQPNASAVAAAVSVGEVDAATQLVFALGRAGVPAAYLDPRDVAFRTSGYRLDALPETVDAIRLGQFVSQSPVTVMPGFYGAAAGHGVALLGRGGSDLTAVFLAERLNAHCILIKDVDGLYEADPAVRTERPRRFEKAHYDDALSYGPELIQSKAIEHARHSGRAIEIRAIGEQAGTRVGEWHSHLVNAHNSTPTRVYLLGLGTVGYGVYEYLIANPERYEISGILVQNPLRHLKAGVAPERLELDAVRALEAIVRTETDVVIEALGGLQPASRLITGALSADCQVITANKELISSHWDSLEAEVCADPPRLRFSAAVGGSVPMMELIRRLRAEGQLITSIRGVINGTCNFILDRMASGVPLDDAVREAQALGFAEANPTADLSGLDAARKLELLSRLAFDATPLCIRRQGLEDSLDALWLRSTSGTRRRLVASVSDQLEGRVNVEELSESDYLYRAEGAENRLEVTTANGAIHRVSGLGAGRYPTALAIIADLIEVELDRSAVRD